MADIGIVALNRFIGPNCKPSRKTGNPEQVGQPPIRVLPCWISEHFAGYGQVASVSATRCQSGKVGGVADTA